MHFFHCPDGSKVVVIAYNVGETTFLTGHKHVLSGGARKQVPTADETPDDAKFIEQCKREVATQLRGLGHTVQL